MTAKRHTTETLGQLGIRIIPIENRTDALGHLVSTTMRHSPTLDITGSVLVHVGDASPTGWLLINPPDEPIELD